MGWWWSKASEVPQGINIVKTLMDIHSDVKTNKGETKSIKVWSEKFEEKFNTHCLTEEKDKVTLRDDICKKIDNRMDKFACPKGHEINGLVKEKGEQESEVAELTKAVNGMVAEKETVEKIRKAIWKKVGFILTYTFLGIGAFAALATWLAGVW